MHLGESTASTTGAIRTQFLNLHTKSLPAPPAPGFPRSAPRHGDNFSEMWGAEGVCASHRGCPSLPPTVPGVPAVRGGLRPPCTDRARQPPTPGPGRARGRRQRGSGGAGARIAAVTWLLSYRITKPAVGAGLPGRAGRGGPQGEERRGDGNRGGGDGGGRMWGAVSIWGGGVPPRAGAAGAERGAGSSHSRERPCSEPSGEPATTARRDEPGTPKNKQ